MGEKVIITERKRGEHLKPPFQMKNKANGPGLNLSYADRVLHLQRTIGNREVSRLIRSGIIRAKLSIGQPGDIYEQEADRVADQVMRMPDEKQSLVNGHWSMLQRKSSCPGCEEEERPISLKASAGCGGSDVMSCVESHINALKGSGQSLSPATRGFFEPRFGADFSQVRVHTGSDAAAIATEINAKAFTTGNDIFFNTGQYSPGTSGGKSLLAHELTHTLQQRTSAGGFGRRIQRQLPPPGDCSFGEHRALQNEVDRACDRERRCTQNDDCATIDQRIGYNAECIRARLTINARCFRGGDLGHAIALANAVGALVNCWAVKNRRCQPQPVPVPAPAPEPVRERAPVVDRGFMDRMAAITGLTGTALIIYLIISEGSRLFPPRNLVPVP